MNDLIEKVESISTINEHYLVKAKSENHPYFDALVEAGGIVKSIFSEKEYDFWCKEKMILKLAVFPEKTFIQYAVETSVVAFFGTNHPDTCKVEVKINPDNDKDVDCCFVDKGFSYCVEVKCSDFVAKELIDAKDGYKYNTIGRLPDKGQDAIEAISTALNESAENKLEEAKLHVREKNMDNNLKDFLLSAHDKFNSTPEEKNVNVLLVGCGDEDDIQNWVGYLWAEQGLFKSDSFQEHNTYKNVDIVVLTNLYYRHSKYWTKNLENWSWSLDNSFNLIMCNPYRSMDKRAAIENFVKILPNYSAAIDAYIVPGYAPNYVKDSVKVSFFVKDYLQQQNGIYLFDKAPDIAN